MLHRSLLSHLTNNNKPKKERKENGQVQGLIKMNEKAANGQTLKDLQKAGPDQRIISLAH